jgi:hypothetical protein
MTKSAAPGLLQRGGAEDGMSTSDQRDSSRPEPLQHEFNTQQDRTIRELANEMRWIAFPLMAVGVLYVVATASLAVQAFSKPELIVSAIYVFLAALFFLTLGGWTSRAADSFQRITTSSGRDISHLMEALDNLRKKYSLLSLLVKIYVAILVVSLIVAVCVALFGPSRG